MNRTLVLAEWRLARNALRAAQLLARHGIYADAVSRANYAVPHAAKAALQTKDISAESHAAVKRLFGLHFVKTEEFEPFGDGSVAMVRSKWHIASGNVTMTARGLHLGEHHPASSAPPHQRRHGLREPRRIGHHQRF